jgi:hypothetical protein
MPRQVYSAGELTERLATMPASAFVTVEGPAGTGGVVTAAFNLGSGIVILGVEAPGKPNPRGSVDDDLAQEMCRVLTLVHEHLDEGFSDYNTRVSCKQQIKGLLQQLNRPHRCLNCGKRWRDDQVFPFAKIPNFFDRVAPGETVPSGECPECHALTHLVTE